MLAGDLEATFVPADPSEPPAGGALVLWAVPPARAPSADGEVPLVIARGRQARLTHVAAQRLPLGQALPLLVALPADAPVTRSVAAWATAAKVAVDLVARGRLLPAAGPGGLAAWRVGPLDPADHRRLDDVALAMPARAHAVPIPGTRPLRMRSARHLLGEFVDAAADRIVRTAARWAAGGGPFASPTSAQVDAALAAWLAEVGVVAADRAYPGLRLHLPDGPDGDFAAVVQLRSHLDPSLVIDAADLWDAPGPVLARLGDHADTDLLLSLRRAARVWSPMDRLLDKARPEALALDDGEVVELLGPAAEALAGAGMEVLWPTDLLTGGVRLRSSQDLDERGFACAVDANQRHPVAALDDEIGAAENQVAAIALGDLFEFRHHAAARLRLREGEVNGFLFGRDLDPLNLLQFLDAALHLFGLGGLRAKAVDEGFQLLDLVLLVGVGRL